jgi:hypothetical protein
MIISPSGTLSDVGVGLPATAEGNVDNCPDSDDYSTDFPLPLDFPAWQEHGNLIAFPLDGLALRQHFDTPTIIAGVDPLGPELPPEDCVDPGSFVTECSAAGSSVQDVVTVTPLAGA